MSYTNVSKPTGASYTNLAKPLESSVISINTNAEPFGLLIAITSVLVGSSSSVTSGWSNIIKPVTSVGAWTNISKPT